MIALLQDCWAQTVNPHSPGQFYRLAAIPASKLHAHLKPVCWDNRLL